MEYTDKIKKARKAKGLSQGEMATLIGTTQSSYSDLERGKVTLTVPMLEKICKVLDLDFTLKGQNEAVVVIDNYAPITQADLDESLNKMQNNLFEKLSKFFSKK